VDFLEDQGKYFEIQVRTNELWGKLRALIIGKKFVEKI
jgi:hypothetical protein